MPTVTLDNRALLSVAGPDAAHFLQNILTCDLDSLRPGEAKPGALLTPQGKILFDFLISRDGPDGFVIECRADAAEDFMRRLMLYRLRAKAEITKRDQHVVTVVWSDDSPASSDESASSHDDSSRSGDDSGAQEGDGLADLRFPGNLHVRRRYVAQGEASAEAAVEAWTALRIAHGVAESGADYELGDAFPHDVSLDQNGGVGFRKGCFVGQEVVSRMQHRGTARRRILNAAAEGALPEPGTPVTAGGKPLGALGSVAGQRALAIVRIDRAKDAMDAGTPIMAGDVEITLAPPPGVSYRFPEEASSGDDA